MSAAEDDTELRDLLIQNLENSGALDKLKAEMRAAVFLAMEEQDKLENKSPLINEGLKKCLNTKDGRLVASLIVDFLQVFNLDFTLAVFQPEINSINSLDGRDQVCRELGLSGSDLNRKSPLLLELVRRGRHRDKAASLPEGDRGGSIPKELTQKQITNARKKFDFYDKEHSGSVLREDLKNVFTDLFPTVNRNMLERFITDELRASEKLFSTKVDFQLFLGMYRHLFAQCRMVVLQDAEVGAVHSQLLEQRVSPPPVSKDSARPLSKGDFQQKEEISADRRDRLDLDLEGEEDLDEGDSFFDDPLPKPQKTYGCQSSLFEEKDSSDRTSSHKDVVPLVEESPSGSIVSSMRRGRSLNDLSVLAADSEGEQDEPHSDHSELRKAELSGSRGSPAGSLPEAQIPASGGGGGSSMSEPSLSKNGASQSKERDFKAPNDRTGSLHLDDDIEYDDDFNSHRSDLSKSELSIGEEIEEVSIEGPDHSGKFDESTQDLSVSQISQSQGADYMEDVA